jgi:SAM-dependent methyltransferase
MSETDKLAFLERHAFEANDSADFDTEYYSKHRLRFARTLNMVPKAGPGTCALELGCTRLFQVALARLFGYADVRGSLFSSDVADKLRRRVFSVGPLSAESLTVSLDLEHELFPFEQGTIDLVMCCEVIEHMDIDPMFMLTELNRISRDNATLLITTPNCCSSRNYWKIAHGWRPHFFMQYERARSPHRHNIEWDIHGLATMVRAAGFTIDRLETEDVFESTMPEALALLERSGLSTDHRGDCIFLLAHKTSSVIDRWPEGIYV